MNNNKMKTNKIKKMNRKERRKMVNKVKTIKRKETIISNTLILIKR